MSTTSFPMHLAGATAFTEPSSTAANATPVNPARSRRNSLATDPRFDSPSTRQPRLAPVRRNSDIGGLRAAASTLAATRARAAEELQPLQTIHTAIRTTDSLDDLLAMIDTRAPLSLKSLVRAATTSTKCLRKSAVSRTTLVHRSSRQSRSCCPGTRWASAKKNGNAAAAM
ncbi:hypothetical protein [Paraburkholderia sp.]|uniref:hypothetical protein n=1 Tax=Paraburkholderia sp. TaxID=1926495 RepID=UPI003D6E029F